MRPSIPLVAAIAAGAVFPSLVPAQTRFEAVALSGQPAPHPSGSATFVGPAPGGFTGFEGQIDAFGRVTFWARVQVGDLVRSQVVTGHPDGLAYVLEIGGPVPDLPGYTFGFPFGLNANDAGQVAVSIRAEPGAAGPPFDGVYLFDPPTGLRSVVREGSPIVNVPGATVGSLPVFDAGAFALPNLNARGEVAVLAEVGSNRADALLVADANGVRWFVGWPDRLPGALGNISLIGDPRLDDSGRVSFFSNHGSLIGHWRGLTLETTAAVFLGNTLPLPSFPPGSAAFLTGHILGAGERDWPAINSAGVTLGVGNVLIPGGASPVRAAVAGTPGDLTLVLRADRPVPGLPAGVTLANNFSWWIPERSPVLNDARGFAFPSGLVGVGVGPDNDTAVFGCTFDTPGLIAREGDSLPALGPAARIVRMAALGVSNRNETLLLTSSVPSAQNFFPFDAVWLGKPGRLRLLVREGSPVGVAPGDTRTVARLTVGNQWLPDSQAEVFSDAGEVPVSLVFTDGSGGMFRARLCHADFDDSGTVSVVDVFAFLSAFFTNDPWADLDGDGAAGTLDIFEYLSLFFRGC